MTQLSFSDHRAAQREGGQHRHQRQGQHQRADQGEDHGQRHRPEHLALDPLQGEDRQVDDDDDGDAEQHRPARPPWPRRGRPRSIGRSPAPRRERGGRSSRSSPRRRRRSGRNRWRRGSSGCRRRRHGACRWRRTASTAGSPAPPTSPARRLPSSSSSTTTTRTRALDQVLRHGVGWCVRSGRCGRSRARSRRPAAGSGRSCSTVAFTRATTSRVFSPSSIRATPTTASPARRA